MVASSPEHAVKMMDRAFNEGVVESLLGFYEDAAVVVTELGKLARGKRVLRLFLEQVIASKASARQINTHVADGIALFLSRWTLTTNSSGEASTKQYVAMPQRCSVNSRTATGKPSSITQSALWCSVLNVEDQRAGCGSYQSVTGLLTMVLR